MEQDVPVKIFDSDARKVVVEDDEDDTIPDATPVPVEHESGDAEPPTVKAAEVDAISDPKDEEPAVGHGTGPPPTPPFLTIDLLPFKVDLKVDEPVPSKGLQSLVLDGQRRSRLPELAVQEDNEPEGVFTPAPPPDELVIEPSGSEHAELADDVLTVDGGAFSREHEPSPVEPVIADLDAAKGVEQHAAGLEAAPEPFDIVTVVRCLFVVLLHDLEEHVDQGKSWTCIPSVGQRSRTRGRA